ncbi:MAG: Pantothenate synthetase [Candidatus Angelobacter sp.]|jgi:pantoate--beta-alanine ligase|nr:Pantothenate synthetase [Candidatus Angelobacter sp.]
MRAACVAAKRLGRRLGFVPTMGALHDGHLSLVRAARADCDVVAASIFVNPTQFGPNEDLAKYPRPFERDCNLLEAEKVDLLFAPSAEEMYPAGAATFVHVEGMSERLCGKSRPGHFRGVTTVVAKLFNVIDPDRAYFGQKDAAQAAIIRKMVRDLCFRTEIVVGAIVREANGLAMSSRNVYLIPQERKQALVLYRALLRVQKNFDEGEREVAKLRGSGANVFKSEPQVQMDYVEIVHPQTLEPVENLSEGALVAVAAKVGTTRLIDNIVLPATK